MTTTLSEVLTQAGAMVKGVVKLILKSRRPRVRREKRVHPLIIMGNGPSLRGVIDNEMASLHTCDTMAVNFAANDEAFFEIRPAYYLLADPHFFDGVDSDPNVRRLYDNLGRVTWPLTLFVPYGVKWDDRLLVNEHVTVMRYNCLGIEGPEFFTRRVYVSGRGMPRPRNVLIPAIMVGMSLGYDRIFLAGADHSWMRTLSVDDDNTVVSVQPHFYKDNSAEANRVTAVYRNRPLHDVVYSFYVAFKAYHAIARYARRRGVIIYNATPGSYIDAFERNPLPR